MDMDNSVVIGEGVGEVEEGRVVMGKKTIKINFKNAFLF